MLWTLATLATMATLVSGCRTVGGGDAGATCVFPFTYKGTRYEECTLVDADGGRPWCSTLTDGNGEHVGGRGKWGHCPERGCGRSRGCRTEGGGRRGAACVFPFVHKGRRYSGCTLVDADDGRPWCSTRTDSSGQHVTGQGQWGHCNGECGNDFNGQPATDSDTLLDILKNSGNEVEIDVDSPHPPNIDNLKQ